LKKGEKNRESKALKISLQFDEFLQRKLDKKIERKFKSEKKAKNRESKALKISLQFNEFFLQKFKILI